MAETLFFYDLETSGINAASQRIMQFGGQRTDLDLKPIGEPIDILVKLTDDIVPEPEAIVVHGISPQRTLEEGYTEPQFIAKLYRQIFTPDTTIVGFNNVSFDDEFIRNTLYRNLQDPYLWHWQDRRSRWDMLPVLRMARALRPEGIKWPIKDGKAINTLGELTKANDIVHDNAHDALADVNATIELARLLKKSQPNIFDWLYKVRDKKEGAKLINLDDPKPFVITGGRLPSEFDKTTIAFPIAPDPANSNAILAFDLRYAPDDFAKLTPEEMVKNIYVKRQDRDKISQLPVISVALNKSPTIAPLGVLDEDSQKRIGLTIEEAKANLTKLTKLSHFGELVRSSYELRKPRKVSNDVDFMIYEGFMENSDKPLLEDLRKLNAEQLADFHPNFKDPRLEELLLRYKGRYYPESLDELESKKWHERKLKILTKGTVGAPSLEGYMKRLEALKQRGTSLFLIEQLKLYGELLVPDELI